MGFPTTLSRTTAQRTAQIWGAGVRIFDTDIKADFVGDNATTGAIPTTLIDAALQLRQREIIIPRHRFTGVAIRDGIATADTTKMPGLLWIGHSIIAGSGASDTAHQLWQVVPASITTRTGVTQAAGTNAGQGGQGIAQAMRYVGLATGGTARVPQRSNVLTGVTAVMIMVLRNDTALTTKQWTSRMRALLRSCKVRGVDAFLYIDPPQINQTTGAILDGATFTDKADISRQLAADYGASIIDCDKDRRLFQAQGGDLRTLYADGTHPNDTGHARDAALTVECMLATGTVSGALQNDHPVGDGRLDIVTLTTGAAPTLYTAADVTGTISARTTFRKIQGSEATFKGFILDSGGGQPNMVFSAPAGAKAVIVTFFDNDANNGTATISYSQGGLTLASGVSATGSTHGERSYYYDLTDGGVSDGILSNLTVAAVGGQIILADVSFIVPAVTEYHENWPGAVEAGGGGWSDTTINTTPNNYNYGTVNARTSNTIGDTLTITYYGTGLNIFVEEGSGAGKVSYAIDGGGATTVDLYTAASAGRGVVTLVAKNQTPGWHTVLFTVVAKNASSSGNVVKIGGFRVQSSEPDPSTQYIAIATGETIQLRDKWTDAVIVKAISGTPVINSWKPNDSTISITGASAAAIVRLRR